MTDITLIEMRAIFVLLTHICAHDFQLFLSCGVTRCNVDNWHFRTANNLEAKEYELMVILPHKTLHVCVQFLPSLVIRAQLNVALQDMVYVGLL